MMVTSQLWFHVRHMEQKLGEVGMWSSPSLVRGIVGHAVHSQLTRRYKAYSDVKCPWGKQGLRSSISWWSKTGGSSYIHMWPRPSWVRASLVALTSMVMAATG